MADCTVPQLGLDLGVADDGPVSMSADEIGDLLTMTGRSVRKLAEEGTVPRLSSGRYILADVLKAYIPALRKAAAGRGDDTLTTERARLARAQAIKQERENEVSAGELIPKGDVVSAMQSTFAHCRSRLLSIPTRGANQLAPAMTPGTAKELLTDMIHDALEELSKTRGVPADEVRDPATVGEERASKKRSPRKKPASRKPRKRSKSK